MTDHTSVSPWREEPCPCDLFVGHPPRDVRRMFNTEVIRHDRCTVFDILWDTFVTDEDGTRLRCAVSFTDSYDFQEGFELYLIPEGYTFLAPGNGNRDSASDPSWRRGAYDEVAAGSYAVLVDPEENCVLWRDAQGLKLWRKPFRYGNVVCLREELPASYTVRDAVREGPGRIRLSPRDPYTLDPATGLFAAETDGEMWYTLPLLTGGEEVSLYTAESPAVKNLFVPGSVKLLYYSLPSGFKGTVSADCLRLMPGVERVEECALFHVEGVRRLILPASLKKLEWQYMPELDELVIEGDLTRVLDWVPNPFKDLPMGRSYEALREQLLKGECPPAGEDGRYILRA